MQMLNRLSFITMAVLLLGSSCSSVPIHDYQFCSPLPADLGATCDNLLTPNQQILEEQAWKDLQAKWISEGHAVECTNSQAIADIKSELEKLCSKTHCNYQTRQALSGLYRILKEKEPIYDSPELE